MSHSIGVDIGGTKIATVLVDGTGRVIRRSVAPTPTSSDALIEAVAQSVRGLADEAAPLGVAVAGRVSSSGDRVLQSANLALSGVSMPRLLGTRLGRNATLLNDADAALLGESWQGAAMGHRNVFMVTLGSGVGGAILADGRLLRGAHGATGELGHTTVKRGGRQCGCGGRGCLDQYASGRALARYGSRHKGESLSGRDVTRAAQRGEEWAVSAVTDLAGWLAVGLANAVALVDPEVVLLSGGVGAAGEVVRGPVALALQTELGARGVPQGPTVLTGSLGPDAGAIGAAAKASGRFT